MSLQVLGINHKSAPLGLREKVAFSPEQVNQALTDASNKLGVEMVIVSTCNRTELYCNLGDTDG